MEIKFLCTYWGREAQDADSFLNGVVAEGYDGVEINVPEDVIFQGAFRSALDAVRREHPGFVFYAQQVLPPAPEQPSAYCKRMLQRLEALATLAPEAINAHTGKDHFSFDDNCRIIEAAEEFSQRSGIPLYHEIHRGRFSFHSASLLPYLERFPGLRLTADYSHWCTVSESALEDQEDILRASFRHVAHIHARVGSSQTSQVADPFEPAWSDLLERYTGWWTSLCRDASECGLQRLTITPEAGPWPYMPLEPYTGRPLANQQDINWRMKQYLQEKLTRQL